MKENKESYFRTEITLLRAPMLLGLHTIQQKDFQDLIEAKTNYKTNQDKIYNS